MKKTLNRFPVTCQKHGVRVGVWVDVRVGMGLRAGVRVGFGVREVIIDTNIY